MILKRNTVLTLVTIFSYSFLFFSCNQDDNQGLMMAKSKKDNFTINFDLGNSEEEVPTYFLSFRLVDENNSLFDLTPTINFSTSIFFSIDQKINEKGDLVLSYDDGTELSCMTGSNVWTMNDSAEIMGEEEKCIMISVKVGNPNVSKPAEAILNINEAFEKIYASDFLNDENSVTEINSYLNGEDKNYVTLVMWMRFKAKNNNRTGA